MIHDQGTLYIYLAYTSVNNIFQNQMKLWHREL